MVITYKFICLYDTEIFWGIVGQPFAQQKVTVLHVRGKLFLHEVPDEEYSISVAWVSLEILGCSSMNIVRHTDIFIVFRAFRSSPFSILTWHCIWPAHD